MSPRLAKRHKTHETGRHSETAPARAHLVETRSPWDLHTLARDASSRSKSPSSIPSSKVSSSTSVSFCGARIRLTAPVLESPLVNGAHVLPPHSILQNFLFERARRDRRVTSLILHALRPSSCSSLQNFLLKQTRRAPGFFHRATRCMYPFLVSPLEDGVSLLGLRSGARSQMRATNPPVHARSFSWAS